MSLFESFGQFGWLFLLAAFGCIKQAARRWFPGMSAAVYLLLCAGIGTGSQIYYLLLRPSIYEYAILSGAAFVMLALWQWLLAANQPAEKHGRILFHLALYHISPMATSTTGSTKATASVMPCLVNRRFSRR